MWRGCQPYTDTSCIRGEHQQQKKQEQISPCSTMWLPVCNQGLEAGGQRGLTPTHEGGRECAGEQQQLEEHPLEHHQHHHTESLSRQRLLLLQTRQVRGFSPYCILRLLLLLLLRCLLGAVMRHSKPDGCKCHLQQDFIPASTQYKRSIGVGTGMSAQAQKSTYTLTVSGMGRIMHGLSTSTLCKALGIRHPRPAS